MSGSSRRLVPLVACLALWAGGCGGTEPPGSAARVGGAAGAAGNGFMRKTITIDGRAHAFAVWVPPGWSDRQSWPVILFLHGSAERGDDGVKQSEAGIGPALARDPGRWPAVVVMPQCPADCWWGDPEMEALAMATLEQAIREYRGDRSRLILTGKSMGGNGVWRLAASHPGVFACLVPICGFIHFEGAPRPKAYSGRPKAHSEDGPGPAAEPDYYAEAARAIGSTPVWMFHGEADRSVSIEESRRMKSALEAAGGDVRLTEYAGEGHLIWDRAYAEPGLAEWMMSQRR